MVGKEGLVAVVVAVTSLTKDNVALVGGWDRRGFAEHVPGEDEAGSCLVLVSFVSLLLFCIFTAWKFLMQFLINTSQLEQRRGVVPSPLKEVAIAAGLILILLSPSRAPSPALSCQHRWGSLSAVLQEARGAGLQPGLLYFLSAQCPIWT